MPELMPTDDTSVRICSCRDNELCGDCSGSRGPKPTDWADVREAARNAGWSGRRDPDQRHARIWGLYGDGRMFIDWEHGWVRSWRNRHSHVIDIAGPDASGGHETVRLVNPTPAKVLTAARLVGLGGGE
jgi:hypothetical protein